MNIYLYDKSTKEYLGSCMADSDPEETKIQGKFIPLVPANATLIAPPEYEENEIPVFFDGGWEIKKDYRNLLKVNNKMEVFSVTTLGEQEGFFIVNRELGENIKQNPELYKIDAGKIIKKSDFEICQEKIQNREALFYKEFFETSLGWVRRTVTMKDGSTKDFLSDLLPAIKAGLELGQNVYVITYQKPNFSEDNQDMKTLQTIKNVDSQFIQECLNQLVQDFGL